MIIYCNKIFRCTLADQTLLRSMCDTLYLGNGDVLHSLHQGILCFQNDIRVHGPQVNVPNVMPIGKVWPSLDIQSSHVQSALFAVLLYRILPKSASKHGIYG